jgi:hypothetical protein
VNNSVVLFASPNVSVSLPCTFATETVIPKQAHVQNATVGFTVTYIQSSVLVSVILKDVYGNIAGNVTTLVSSIGIVVVDISRLYASLLQEYQTSFTIKTIHGSVLTVSLGIETQNVAVNLDPNSVTSAVVYTTQATSTTAPTTTQSPGHIIVSISCSISASMLMILFVTLLHL